MILDTPSGKNAATATGATVGFDAGKLVKGRTRLVLTDTLGNGLASRVLPANAADGPAAVAFWDEAAAMHDWLGPVEGVFVDRSFNGVFRQHLARRCGIRVGNRRTCWSKKRIAAFMPGAGLSGAPLPGSVPTADCQKNATGVCPRQRLDLPGEHQAGA